MGVHCMHILSASLHETWASMDSSVLVVLELILLGNWQKMIFLTIHSAGGIKYHMNFLNLFYLSQKGKKREKAKNVLCQDFVAVTFIGCVSPWRAVIAAVVNGIPVVLATASAAECLTRATQERVASLNSRFEGNSLWCQARHGSESVLWAQSGKSWVNAGVLWCQPMWWCCQHAGGTLHLSVNPYEIPSKTLPQECLLGNS